MAASNTFILGTGVIGLSTAFYLSSTNNPSTIHLVNPSPSLFSSASGRAGGFLAADWFSAPLAALGKLSFEEHKRVARENNGREKWGYMRSTGISYTASGTGSEVGRGDDWLREGSSRAEVAKEGVSEFIAEEDGPAWLRKGDGEVEVISEEGSTAQVDPLRLCQFLLQTCLERGVKLHHPGRAKSVGTDMRDELSSIRIVNTETHAETDFPCTKILIAAGAWSPVVFQTLFPASLTKLPISSLAGHSLVVKSQRWNKEHEENGCHAVFTTDSSGYSPEIFSRMGEEIYIAGINSSSIPLPNLATESEIDQRAIQQLRSSAERLVGDDLQVLREGLCFRPVTSRGIPILCRLDEKILGGVKVREEGGVFLAAGHGPWGITNCFGTGKVMSEMMECRILSADVSGLGF